MNFPKKMQRLKSIYRYEKSMGYSEIIDDFEEIIGEKIPQIDNLIWNSFGYSREGETLTGLALFQKSITRLPDQLWDNKSLKLLSLVYTSLEDLPDKISTLSNLEELYLGGNKFENIPNTLNEMLKLKYLYIFESHITEIPDLSNLQNLKELVLLEGIKVPDNVYKMQEKGLKLKFDN